MQHHDVLNFLKKLVYLPLLTGEASELILINKFPKAKTLIFLIADDNWGQTILLSAKNKESYSKINRYIKGLEPFINLENLDVSKENKELEFTVTINTEIVSFKITILPNAEKELAKKFNNLGIKTEFRPTPQ